MKIKNKSEKKKTLQHKQKFHRHKGGKTPRKKNSTQKQKTKNKKSVKKKKRENFRKIKLKIKIISSLRRSRPAKVTSNSNYLFSSCSRDCSVREASVSSAFAELTHCFNGVLRSHSIFFQKTAGRS